MTIRSLMGRLSRLKHRAVIGLIVLACLFGPLTYVLTAQTGYHTAGFPLDDAWIYQVYARNLAHSGQWAFVAGQPSTGSTSVLWTLLITPAYLLGLDGRTWTLVLGTLTLIGAALASASLFPEDRPLLRLATGVGVALEWHVVWAAASGMETGLFAAMLMWFWVWLRRRAPSLGDHALRDGFVLGLWGGALALARPEGIVAFGIAALFGVFWLATWTGRLRWAVAGAIGLLIVIVPWLVFNVATSGAIWPNTFAAKQAEYASLLSTPYVARLADQVVAVWIGPQVLLLPSLVISVRQIMIRKPVAWVSLVPIVWVVVHLALYAARLPVTYQHARYAIPTIPLLVAYGIRGLSEVVRRRLPRALVRVAALSWAVTSVILFPVFLVALGAPAYGRDNRYIQNEMVATANWINQHTSPQAVIAVHDIGALGYYAPHRIIDLAGLVSPDVIGFITDDRRLAGYILAQHADYLVVFPRWSTYANLVSGSEFCKVWSADQMAGYTAASDYGPMTVYQVKPAGGCQYQP